MSFAPEAGGTVAAVSNGQLLFQIMLPECRKDFRNLPLENSGIFRAELEDARRLETFASVRESHRHFIWRAR